MKHSRYYCKVCGISEIDARIVGCGDPESRIIDVPYDTINAGVVWQKGTAACPMELKSRWRRLLYYRFNQKWVL